MARVYLLRSMQMYVQARQGRGLVQVSHCVFSAAFKITKNTFQDLELVFWLPLLEKYASIFALACFEKITAKVLIN